MKQVISEKFRAALLKQEQDYKNQKERVALMDECFGTDIIPKTSPVYLERIKRAKESNVFDFKEETA